VGENEKGKKEFVGGERTPDPALKQAHKAFLAHAQKIFDASGGK